jgi:hypothetical protein
MTSAMGRARISLYLDDEILEAITKVAETQTRSAPNLIEHLVIEYLRDRGVIEKPPEPPIKIQYRD